MFTILICKVLSFLGRLLGRGSSLPGLIALRLNPNILGKLQLPDTVIAVTGSNGKTSATEMLRAAAAATGKRVLCNSEGSNQIEGIATLLLSNSNLHGRVNADIVLLESDERFCQYTFRYFAPSHLLVTNLFRDQTTRNGSSAFVWKELQKGLPASSRLILNADDPVSALFGADRPDTLYFGVTAARLCEAPGTPHAYDDGARCPRCHAPMTYALRVESHLGDYRCAACGYAHPAPTHAVTDVDGGRLVLDGQVGVTPQLLNNIFAYNLAAAYTVAVEVLGMEPEIAAAALDNHTLSNGLVNRVDRFSLDGHDGLFLLSKHENSMAWNGALKTVAALPAPAVTLVLVVDKLSRKYIANDMSWLWEIDFELLRASHVRKIVAGGAFADDVALRLLVAGIDGDAVYAEPDLDAMMALLRREAVGELCLMTCFTDIDGFNRRLPKERAV